MSTASSVRSARAFLMLMIAGCTPARDARPALADTPRAVKAAPAIASRGDSLCQATPPFAISQDSIGPFALRAPLDRLRPLCAAQRIDTTHDDAEEYTHPELRFRYDGFELIATQSARTVEMGEGYDGGQGAYSWEVVAGQGASNHLLLPGAAPFPTTLGALRGAYGRLVVNAEPAGSSVVPCGHWFLWFLVEYRAPRGEGIRSESVEPLPDTLRVDHLQVVPSIDSSQTIWLDQAKAACGDSTGKRQVPTTDSSEAQP